MGLSASLNCKSATVQLLWEPELSECYQFAALISLPEVPLEIFSTLSFKSLQGPSHFPLLQLLPTKIPAFFQTKKAQICFFAGLKPIYPTADLTQWLPSNSCMGSQAHFAEAPARMNYEEQKYISSLPCLMSWEPSRPTASFLPLEKSNNSQPLFIYWGQYKPRQVLQLSAFTALCKYRCKWVLAFRLLASYKHSPWCYKVSPAARNGGKPSDPAQTKILAEGRDKLASVKDTEPEQNQCTCFSKWPLHEACGRKVAKSQRALTGD